MTKRTFTRAEIADAIHRIPPPPENAKGRVILFFGSGMYFFANAWVSVRMLRTLGCQLPIEVWSAEVDENDERHRRLLAPWGAVWRSDFAGRLANPLGAILQSAFDEILYLGAGNIPLVDPEALFESAPFRDSGAIFWPGLGSIDAADAIWEACELHPAPGAFDFAQFLVSKQMNWEPLCFAHWLMFELNMRRRAGETSLPRADAACFLSWQKFGASFSVPAVEPRFTQSKDNGSCLPETIVQHDFEHQPAFQRLLGGAWLAYGQNSIPAGFLYGATFLSFLEGLRASGYGLRPDLGQTVRGEALALRESLFEPGWMLEGWRPYPDGRDDVPLSQSQKIAEPLAPVGPQKRIPAKGEKYQKTVHFAPDGTFGKWSDGDLMFWELHPSGTGMELYLSGGDGPGKPGAVLRWDGSGAWTGQRVSDASDKKLLRLWRPAANFPAPGGEAKKLRVRNSSQRLSDHIVSIYACAAAAQRGMEVHFFTPFHEWLRRVDQDGLEVEAEGQWNTAQQPPAPHEHPIPEVDLNQFRGRVALSGGSRAKAYASLLAGDLVPRRPARVDLRPTAPRFEIPNYILLFPFASGPALEWPEVHWRRLAILLREKGYETFAIGPESSAERYVGIFDATTTMWILNPDVEWTMDAMLGAAGVVGSACWPAHLAGLFGKPTLALHAQLPAECLWEASSVTSIVAETHCTACRCNPDHGYTRSCELGCSAMATISPERVLHELIQTISRHAN